MEFYERLQQRMSDLNLRVVDIMKFTGVTSAGVSQWKNGITKPKGDRLVQLAQILRCTPEWLQTGRNPQKQPDAVFEGGFVTRDHTTVLHKDEVEIPFYSEIEHSAGNGRQFDGQHAGKWLHFSKSTLKKRNILVENASCITISGNSMSPILPNGTTIGVDSGSTAIKDGEIYAINHDGVLRVKIIYQHPTGGIRLRSYNLEEYPDESYARDTLGEIRIIGRIFWYSVLR